MPLPSPLPLLVVRGSGGAAAIPVPVKARPGRPSLGGKGGRSGVGDEVDARRSFLESAFSQSDAGATMDWRGFAEPGYAGDDDDSAGSDL